MSLLQGQTAFVTGAGTGIGKAIAQDLAAAGVKVIVCGRRPGPLEETVQSITAVGGVASAVTCDLTDPDAIEECAQALLAEHGTIDILINNAGFSSKIRSSRYIGAEEWRDVMDVNTMGPVVLTKALLPAMVEKGRGDVVMISSMAAINPSIMAGAAYSAAKVAARAYMNVLAQEMRPYGIRCITVFPGEVDTPILDNRALPPDAETRARMMMPEDISAAVLMAVSLPRRAMVSELAIAATDPRDMSADVAAAKTKQTI
ncbi:MAG: SDR family oxidoreductase [Rhodospirillaceae bacterium]|jgi:NADP-dependent 3-hydroxy acid dehydrogenase YdfG|nr:SDR family oxidoreductase [Rhodospirillaceae bacterium]MBT4042675.1 SDR family oxidoreductase [Rhodospirillaceae bacterium]MBT4687764.1 SDR family oxidoreductase [Rhodospirillaceae bacterium]MBT5082812.1 SDR family oxidoreductase [Rhodospirillaceae bacterium]MBT5524256.1 SDR family oxidoreductase [Rhodospirillaceae bacterium]